ncbi:hypothetical protein JL09_g6449, partial [Pichia kudriavzevii]
MSSGLARRRGAGKKNIGEDGEDGNGKDNINTGSLNGSNNDKTNSVPTVERTPPYLTMLEE